MLNIIIYLKKSPCTLRLERSCNKFLYLNDDLSFIQSDPDAAFQPIAKARVFYFHIIQLFELRHQGPGTSPYLSTIPDMPYRHEKEKHWEHCRVEMGFLV